MEKDQRLSLSLVFNLVLALEKTRACTVPPPPTHTEHIYYYFTQRNNTSKSLVCVLYFTFFSSGYLLRSNNNAHTHTGIYGFTNTHLNSVVHAQSFDNHPLSTETRCPLSPQWLLHSPISLNELFEKTTWPRRHDGYPVWPILLLIGGTTFWPLIYIRHLCAYRRYHNKQIDDEMSFSF